MAAVRANARPGVCGSCGKSVEISEGFSYLDPDRGWSASCSDPGCRALCGTREPAGPPPETEGAQRKAARDAAEVFGLAQVALSRDDDRLALEVCLKLVGIERSYELVPRRS